MPAWEKMIRWGKVKTASADKGPYRLAEVESDGKVLDVHIIDPFGLQGNPHVDGEVLIFTPDADDGKACGIVMPRPKDRWDGLKPGEVGLKNFDKGQTIHMDANGAIVMASPNGDTLIKSPGGIVHINPPG